MVALPLVRFDIVPSPHLQAEKYGLFAPFKAGCFQNPIHTLILVNYISDSAWSDRETSVTMESNLGLSSTS
jgi:hypothetical protein